MKRKGYVMTWDAILALIFILLVFVGLITMEHTRSINVKEVGFLELYSTAEDSIEVLNKMGALEEIVIYWSENNTQLANDTATFYLEQFIPEKMGYRLTIGNDTICEDQRILEATAVEKTKSTRFITGYGSEVSIYTREITVNVDAVLATDLSGSMDSGGKLADAKAASKEFVSIVLNESGNRVGLVSYGDSASEGSAEAWDRWNTCCLSTQSQIRCSTWVRVCTNWNCDPYNPYDAIDDRSFVRPDYYGNMLSNGYSDAHIDSTLTDDGLSLNNTIDSYSANGGTCIGCGIHAAVKALLLQGDSSHSWAILIMTDGKATMAPMDSEAADTYSMEAYMPDDFECTDYSPTGKDAAVEAAREAYETYDIAVYAVGFGTGVNEADLMEIAAAGDGEYYYAADSGDLEEIYTNISREIAQSSSTEEVSEVNTSSDYIARAWLLYNNTETGKSYSIADVGYGEAFKHMVGCEWLIEHINKTLTNENVTVRIPEDYPGSNECNYTGAAHSAPGGDDAINDAIYRIVNKSDTDNDGIMNLIDGMPFNETSMTFKTSNITTGTTTRMTEATLILWMK